MDFLAKQINDVRPTDLADALMALSVEGFAEWTIMPQEDETTVFENEDGRECSIWRVTLFCVLAWREASHEGP